MKGFSASLDMRSCKDWDCQASVCSSVLVSTMIKAFSITAPRVLDKPCVIALRQISVTALFYLEIARESILEEEKTPRVCARGWGDRERESARMPDSESEPEQSAHPRLAPLIHFPPPGPALCKLGSARSAVLPEVLTPVLCSIF